MALQAAQNDARGLQPRGRPSWIPGLVSPGLAASVHLGPIPTLPATKGRRARAARIWLGARWALVVDRLGASPVAAVKRCDAKTGVAALARVDPDPPSKAMQLADRLVVPFDAVGLESLADVGGKNASLGELIRNLAPLGVKVPAGFATTAAA